MCTGDSQAKQRLAEDMRTLKWETPPTINRALRIYSSLFVFCLWCFFFCFGGFSRFFSPLFYVQYCCHASGKNDRKSDQHSGTKPVRAMASTRTVGGRGGTTVAGFVKILFSSHPAMSPPTQHKNDPERKQDLKQKT